MIHKIDKHEAILMILPSEKQGETQVNERWYITTDIKISKRIK